VGRHLVTLTSAVGRGFQELVVGLELCVVRGGRIRQQVVQHPAYRVLVHLHHGTDTSFQGRQTASMQLRPARLTP
jgi:hypothetical protein